MKHFPTFSTHLSRIVWSENLVAMQPVDGDSATPVKWKKFYSRRAPSRNVTAQVIEFLGKMQDADISPVTKVLLLQTLYNSDSNPRSPSNFKNSPENSKEIFVMETVFSSFMDGRLEISNYLKGTLLKTLFQKQPTEVFCKSVFKNFPKFTGKDLCQCLFLNQVAGLRH